MRNHEGAVVSPARKPGFAFEASGESRARYAAFFDRFRAAARFCPRPMVLAKADRA